MTVLLFLVGLLLGSLSVEAQTVSGRVLTESGDPLPEATVHLTKYLPLYEKTLRELDGLYEPPVAVSVGADDEGWFRVLVPRPGVWGLRVEAPGYVPMYRWDEPVLEDLHLPQAALARDEGQEVRVTDPEGRPIPSARVRFVLGDAPRRFSKGWRRLSETKLTDSAGRAILPRAEGEVFRVIAWAPDRLQSELRTVEGETIDLTLPEGQVRDVEVRATQGHPVEDAVVEWDGWPMGRTDESGSLHVVLPEEDRTSSLVALAEDGRWARISAFRPGSSRLVLPELLTVRGRVVDATTEAPVAGAVAEYRGWGMEVAETDSNGELVMHVVPVPSSWDSLPLRWSAAGYVGETVKVTRNDPQVEVALEPARRVQGRVTTADGQPMAGATVWVRPAEDPQWRPHGYGTGSETKTTGDGELLFRHVWRWKEWPTLEVEARAPGWAPAIGRVPAGRGASDMALVLPRGAEVTGRVVDSEGAPIPQAPVYLYVEESRLSRRTLVSSVEAEPDFQSVADEDGTFRVTELPEDRFDILIDPPGFGGRILRAVEVPAEGDVDLGQIELEPSGSITGVVLDPQDRPLPKARVTLLSGDVSSRSLPGPPPLEVTGGTSIETDAAGRFRFEDVPLGERYVLHASASGRVPSMAFDVAASEAEPMELVLRPAARIFGWVKDPSEGPVTEVLVQLIDPEQGGILRFPIRRKRTDEHGRFVFEGLPSGTYGFVLGDELLKNFEVRAEVNLEEGEERGPVVLMQENRAILEVSVVSPQGEPVVDANVSVQVVDGPRIEIPAGAEGQAVFEDLPPGEVLVSARHEQLGTADESRRLQPGRNEVGLILESGGQIRGRVVDKEGEPVSNASLDLEPVQAHLSALAFSESDGSFVLDAPSPGTYRLRVEAPGWASFEYPELLEVGTQDIEGIEVRLSRGADLVGHVRGLTPEELSHVTVSAESRSTRRRVRGAVSHEGGYRIEGLGAGSWKVTGELEEPRRVVEEQVTLEAGDEQAELDLIFPEGYTLTGVVRLRDEPASGAILSLHGDGIEIEDRTNGAGSFRIAGLEPGEYWLHVWIFGTDVSTERKLSLTGDQALEIDLLTTRVSGRLVTPDGQGMSGVNVHLFPTDDPQPIRHMHSVTTTLDDGRFVLPPVLEGTYRLVAQAPAEGTAARVVEAVGPAVDLEDVQLETGSSLAVQPRFSDGSTPENVGVVLLDASRILVGGDQVAVDVDGLARIGGVPDAARSAVVFPGTPDPWVAPAEISISTGSTEPIAVVFPVGSQILVRWSEGQRLHAGVKVRKAGGHLPPQLEFNALGWIPMEDQEQAIGSLLPGTWTVELLMEDGQIQSREVVTRPRQTTEVVFPASDESVQ